MAITYEDYYQTLGVQRSASTEEITQAYRKLARKLHPDVNKAPDAQEQFAKINEAHEVLKDAEKRRRYDMLGANWKAGQEFRPSQGAQNMNFHFRGGPGSGGFGFNASGFSSFFDALFGQDTGQGGGGGFGFDLGAGGPGARAAPRHEPRVTEHDLSISLEEAFHGATRNLRLTADRSARSERSLDVRIPPGVTEGSRIRLKGEGGGGTDLILKISLQAHARYTVEGDDLIAEIPVTPWEAALGAKVDVDTFDGRATVTVPAGASSGTRLRLRGRGMKGKSGRGDLLIRLRIVVPESMSDEERALFEKLRDVSDFRPRER
ncbi:MAG: hypothetical protein CMJ18_20475 [Phycisphaeraceae bacterium]|nr:hypothetical protein [Phycisphaeraceae bacterium]